MIKDFWKSQYVGFLKQTPEGTIYHPFLWGKGYLLTQDQQIEKAKKIIRYSSILFWLILLSLVFLSVPILLLITYSIGYSFVVRRFVKNSGLKTIAERSSFKNTTDRVAEHVGLPRIIVLTCLNTFLLFLSGYALYAGVYHFTVKSQPVAYVASGVIFLCFLFFSRVLLKFITGYRRRLRPTGAN